MKHLSEKTIYLQNQILDWVLIKGPELFIAIYGR